MMSKRQSHRGFQKYKRHRQPWKGKKIQKTHRTNEDVKTLGIPRDWFPRDAERFRVQKFKVQPPTEFQKKKGYLGEKGKPVSIYSFRCQPGGLQLKYKYPDEEGFEEWIKTDQAKNAVLFYGPYWHPCVWEQKIYLSHHPYMQEYYEKFDTPYYDDYLSKKETKFKEIDSDPELIRTIIWYTETMANVDKLSVAPKIALDAAKQTIDEFIKQKEYMEKLRSYRDNPHKYKHIHGLLDRRTWF